MSDPHSPTATVPSGAGSALSQPNSDPELVAPTVGPVPGEMSDPEGWRFVPGLVVEDANRLLDWLQNQGVEMREIKFQLDGFVTVRWKC
jgi:hypothetical protein